jgi:hypothetical protein
MLSRMVGDRIGMIGQSPCRSSYTSLSRSRYSASVSVLTPSGVDISLRCTFGSCRPRRRSSRISPIFRNGHVKNWMVLNITLRLCENRRRHQTDHRQSGQKMFRGHEFLLRACHATGVECPAVAASPADARRWRYYGRNQTVVWPVRVRSFRAHRSQRAAEPPQR